MEIKTYPIGSENYNKLVAAAGIMTAFTEWKMSFLVKNTYFDVGRDILWTTIICRKNEDNYSRSEFQCLTPKEQLEILKSQSPSDLATVVTEIISDNEVLWRGK